MNTDYLKGLPELEIVILAKNGDKNAVEHLWKKYRKMMINVLWLIPISLEEKESEAADIFMHKLKNVFNPAKVRKTKEEWEFFSILYQGMICRRGQLRKNKIYLSYDESEFESESESKILNAEKVCLSHRELFTRYNPEHAVVSELDFEIKTRQLYGSINGFQKTIMRLLQEGLSIEQVAKKIGYTPFEIWCNCKTIEKRAKEIYAD